MKNETKNLFKAAGIYVALIAIIFGGIELTTTVYGNIRNKVICRSSGRILDQKAETILESLGPIADEVLLDFSDYLMVKMYGFVIDITGDKKQRTLVIIDCLKKKLDEPLEVV